MNEQYPTAEFLVICRGEWDSTLLQKEKQNVIDQFYAWFDELVDQGKIKRGPTAHLSRQYDRGKRCDHRWPFRRVRGSDSIPSCNPH
jgi:hypothetical protein